LFLNKFYSLNKMFELSPVLDIKIAKRAYFYALFAIFLNDFIKRKVVMLAPIRLAFD
jgi:hypothetical protein